MITYAEFERYMKYVQRKEEADNRIQEILGEYHDVYSDGMMPIDNGTSIINELLEEVFNLPHNDMYGTTLSWWIWELEFGKKFEIGDLINNSLPEDDKYYKPDLKTLKQLYDYLVWEGENNKKDG